MEEIDALREKNLNLINRLKLGQARFRTLVKDSEMNISLQYIQSIS